MFIGHFALGLAAKKIAPQTSLGTLMLSVGFVDVLWPFFLILGWEHVRIDPGNTAFTPLDFYDYPFSHSLVGGAVWAILFACVYFCISKYKRGAIVVFFGVLSHWILDFLTHKPDMPIFLNGGPLVGLGLWNSIPATFAVEIPLFIWGIWVYLTTTTAKNKIGSWGFGLFMALMFFVYLGNVFGPPPPNLLAIEAFGPLSLILFLFPYLIDRHRPLTK